MASDIYEINKNFFIRRTCTKSSTFKNNVFSGIQKMLHISCQRHLVLSFVFKSKLFLPIKTKHLMEPLSKINMIYLDMPNFIFSQSSPLFPANSLESFSLLGEVQNENKVPMQSQPNANAKKSLFLCQNCPNILYDSKKS